MKNVAVIGAGAWGTTLSKIICENNNNVSLWCFEKSVYENILNGENKTFLPNIKLKNIKVSQSLEEILKNAEIIIFAVPSNFFKNIVLQCKKFINKDVIIANATKGFSPDLKTMTEILSETLNIDRDELLTISGPNIAIEIANKTPSSTVIGYSNKNSALILQSLIMTDYFRVYICDDIIGVELGGCLKNIISIASGICDGLGLGANTKASLLTRGLAEITRLGVELGAKPYTFSGLSGMGDLIATSMSKLSRNRTFGEKIAKKNDPKKIINSQKQVIEGVDTANSALKIAKSLNISMPITEQVVNIIFNNKDPQKALNDLMVRSPKEEVY